MSSSREPDRLVLFTDAVVAIAVTLLVLPLVDVVSESQAEGLTAVEAVTEHQAQIRTFLLSFVVIARFWLVHHRVFEHVRQYSPQLMGINFVWLLGIVLLPVPTELSGIYPTDRFTSGLYIGTTLLISLSQTVLVLLIRRQPELEKPDNPISRPEYVGSLVATGIFAIAFLLATLVPGVNYYALLLLLPAKLITRAFSRRRPADAEPQRG